ncbi:MAG: alkaline phosphatase [Thermoleophilia bacterium]|nr:alkaline phosphatase [Thermoleophilia bacterium]
MSALLEHIASTTLDILQAHGIWAVFFLMFLESACIPAPSEVIMLFGGYLVYTGDDSMFLVVAAGVVGNVLGSILAWGVGAYGGRTLVEHHGRRIRLNMHHLDRSHAWFERWGVAAVFFGRMLPVVRTFISLPAGIARMNFTKFVFFTTLGCIPWVWGLTLVGKHLGPNYEDARHNLHKLDDAVIALILLGFAWLVFRFVRARRARASVDVAAHATDGVADAAASQLAASTPPAEPDQHR